MTVVRQLALLQLSPSMRREWIEIFHGYAVRNDLESPSMRREWIEIGKDNVGILHKVRSPSMRREWIEIPVFTNWHGCL